METLENLSDANLPDAPSCERNRDPILKELKPILIAPTVRNVLEVGSGTGQHAVYFAEHLPHLHWQTADRPENHAGIRAWIRHSGRTNVADPLHLDLGAVDWAAPLAGKFQAVFTANTLHIVAWSLVESFMRGAAGLLGLSGPPVGAKEPNNGAIGNGQTLNPQSRFVCIYGPFNYNGDYTSESNARFDDWLKQRDPSSGIRDFESVEALARRVGLRLRNDLAMPANNRLLVFTGSC